MPDRNYISRQLAIFENPAFPESIRQDALCRAVSNSNLHGGTYPSPENISFEELRAYFSICSSFVRGEIDLNQIQAQAEELIAKNYQDPDAGKYLDPSTLVIDEDFNEQ